MTTPMGIRPVSPPESPFIAGIRMSPQTYTQTGPPINTGDFNMEEDEDTNEDDEMYNEPLRRQVTAGEYLNDNDHEKQGSTESSEDNDGGLYGHGLGVVTPKAGDINTKDMFDEEEHNDDVYGQGITTAGE